MPDLNCPKCNVVVLRRREGIGHAARRSRINMTWANGLQVRETDRLVCPTCQGELSLDPVRHEPALALPSPVRAGPGES